MSAKLITDPALTMNLPRKGLDVAGLLGEPTTCAALRVALSTFIHTIQE